MTRLDDLVVLAPAAAIATDRGRIELDRLPPPDAATFTPYDDGSNDRAGAGPPVASRATSR